MVEHETIDGVEYITFALEDFESVSDPDNTSEYRVDDYFFSEDPINIIADEEQARKWASGIVIGIPEDWAFLEQTVVALGYQDCQTPVNDAGWACYQLLQERWKEGVLTDIKVTLKVVEVAGGKERYEFVKVTTPTPEEIKLAKAKALEKYNSISEFGIF